MTYEKQTHGRFRKFRILVTIAMWILSLGMLWAFFNVNNDSLGLILGGVLLLIWAIGFTILQLALGARSGLNKQRTADYLDVDAREINYDDGHWYSPSPLTDPEFHEAMVDRSEPVQITDHYEEWDSSDDGLDPNYIRLVWKDASTSRKRKLSFTYGLNFIGLLSFFDRWHIPYTFTEISDHNLERYEAYTKKDADGISQEDREWAKYDMDASMEDTDLPDLSAYDQRREHQETGMH